MNTYLKYAKEFSSFVNSRRKNVAKKVFFERITSSIKVKNSARVLEVGCNDRPIVTDEIRREFNVSLYGIDPDPSLNPELMIQFEEFTITKLEDFKSKTKFDVVILNTVLEHTESNCKCFGVLKDLLKEDGVILSYQPSNLHPFSILNRLFSHGFKLKVLKILRPWAEVGEITGWRSYYDNCNIMGFKKLCRRFNLSITDACFNYNGSDYFTFFPPLFVVIVIYEEFVKLLGLPILCSTFFVEIRHDTK